MIDARGDGEPKGASGLQNHHEHMLGHGFYNKHSQEQGLANRHALPLLAAAVNAVDPAIASADFRIADYGSAQGRNSLLPIKIAIKAIKERWQPAPDITVIHTDLPGNDWTTLFQTVLTSPDSYLQGEAGVFSLASGTSVYSRIFPANHIALGYSAIVEHWLSRRPPAIEDHIWSTRASGQTRAAWAAQARSDWRGFLSHRAAELIPTGRLVVVGSGADHRGLSGAEPLIDLVNRVLEAMVREGSLLAVEYGEMAIPTYYRTEAEWREPFEDEGFLAANPLRLLHYQEFAEDDVYLAEYERSGDARAFAREYTAFFRAAFEPSLFHALHGDRDQQERQNLIEEFSSRLREALAQDPPGYSARWWLNLMVIAKE